ncbi:hypothetical protein IV389_13215 [Enterococcus faecium]|uniref:hypothetical protein n=1 Tax=Enterococcus faecium TaxID=1352 RepID=UPI001BDC6E99|nr:hypothetical protein [Enterococcus faecium]MCD4923277.1 hypothetical protein [Enterococcus faecium]MCD5027758.1 hypothetical protein [Enterococcus faecium]MCD5056577.1 hypothetical protein [Enterococcus faecium]MCD5064696.1 hypothetical protein [Enterococcus faecium]MCD5134350.1 hypothetical protein [Enterococcus faecium]
MYYKYEKIKSIYIIPLIIIVTVALIPLFLLLFFKAIDDNTWIDFFGGYLGSIISAIVAGGLAFYISNAESERQRIQLDKQLEAQKKIDIKVQSDFLKKQLIIEKKSKVLTTIMDLNNTLPKMHNYINSNIEMDKEINKEIYDNYAEDVQIIFIGINTTSAFIPEYKEKFANLYIDYLGYEKELRSLVIAKLTRDRELEQGNDLVEIDPGDLKDFVEELKAIAKVRKERGDFKSSKDVDNSSFFINSFSISRDSVEKKYNDLLTKSIDLYKEVDNSLFNDVRKL